MQVPGGGKLSSAQQAKLRAEAVQTTTMFFEQSKRGKPEDGMIPQDKNMDVGRMQKIQVSNAGGQVNEVQCLPSSEVSQIPKDKKEASENVEVPAGEE